jgi:hypothetical protein
MTKRAKEAHIVGRKVSGGAHLSRLGQHEQRHHEQRYVY